MHTFSENTRSSGQVTLFGKGGKTRAVRLSKATWQALPTVIRSLRLADAGMVELLTEALHRLITLAYERDDAGWVNVDPVTKRLLIPAPWGAQDVLYGDFTPLKLIHCG